MYRSFFKRLLDFIGSLLFLPFLFIIIIIFSPLIFLEDRGSIFYLDKRLGKNSVPFKMFKFRTMKINAPDIRNADGSTYNSSNDTRLTKIGKFLRKFSIDELPQVLNIFLGHMSFVGPRPSTLLALESNSENLKKKMSIRPGVTGYSQAYYRNSVHGEERYRQDVYYLENMSFLMDIKIILKTFINVIKKNNVYTNDK